MDRPDDYPEQRHAEAGDARQLAPRILVTTDFGRGSDHAFYHALSYAVARQARLTVLHTGPERRSEVHWERYPGVRETLARWGLLPPDAPRLAVFETLHVNIAKVALRDEDACRSIIDYLRLYPTDLLIMAARRRRGLARLLGRSLAGRVATQVRSPTLILPKKGHAIVDPRSGRPKVRRLLWLLTADQHAQPGFEALQPWLPAFAEQGPEVAIARRRRQNQPEIVLPQVSPQRWELLPVEDMKPSTLARLVNRARPDLIAFSPLEAGRWRSRSAAVDGLLRRLNLPLLALPGA